MFTKLFKHTFLGLAFIGLVTSLVTITVFTNTAPIKMRPSVEVQGISEVKQDTQTVQAPKAEHVGVRESHTSAPTVEVVEQVKTVETPKAVELAKPKTVVNTPTPKIEVVEVKEVAKPVEAVEPVEIIRGEECTPWYIGCDHGDFGNDNDKYFDGINGNPTK